MPTAISGTPGGYASATTRARCAGAAECCWIFDLLASEVAPLLAPKANDGTFRTSILIVRVVDSRATLEVTDSGDAPPLWSNNIPWTDFPQGQWTLFGLGPLELDASGCASIVAILVLSTDQRGWPWTAKSTERLAWCIEHDAVALLAELRAGMQAKAGRLAT